MSATEQLHQVRPELVEAGLLVPVEELHTHPSNPRRGDIGVIAESLVRFGQMRELTATQDGTIVAGNHTYRAAVSLGWTHVAAVRMELSEADEAGYLITDNRTQDLATYDDAILLEHLQRLQADDNLAGTGFDLDDVTDLAAALAALGDEPLPDEEDAAERGAALTRLDTSVAEPHTKLEPGSVVALGPHLLVVASVYYGHDVWGRYLDEDAERLFIPYPMPTLPLTLRAEDTRLVMVQPDLYLAGHLVDKWRSVKGDDLVEHLV